MRTALARRPAGSHRERLGNGGSQPIPQTLDDSAHAHDRTRRRHLLREHGECVDRFFAVGARDEMRSEGAHAANLALGIARYDTSAVA